MAVSRPNDSAAAARFGTFAGVFTPNILTILGLILFLRLGQVVGETGLWGALLIVLLANSISLLTGLSLAAVATNMRIGAGGNYYIISRSLGLEVGGAIGIPLFLSQAISVAFYIIGFTESLRTVEVFAGLDPRLIASGVALLFIAIAYVGADFALKIQFFILAVLLAALVSFFTGGWGAPLAEPVLTSAFAEGSGFWLMFALFFPAVTGIEVGVSLSGDLKDPSRSIPRGTIASILFTAAVYVAAVVWLATRVDRAVLLTDSLVMQQVASVPGLILAGVWASTLSSALGSVLAAPRTLQAIATDRVVPGWIASRLGSRTEPRMAVLVTGVIALAVIWAGELNVVAPVITMFFLNTYGMVNVAASIERLVGNPSFRPRFSVPWPLSALGGLGCYGAMFLISPVATVVAVVVSTAVFFALQRRQLQRTWGDVRSGLWIAIARYALLNLESDLQQAPKTYARNWRPNLIVFTGQPHHREQLVAVSDWLSRGQGIVTFFQFIVGKFERHQEAPLRDTARRHIRQYIDDHGMKAFAEAEIVPEFEAGALTVAQAHGIGGLEANSVLMGWSNTPKGRADQLRLMRELVALRKSVFLLSYDFERGFGQHACINVWWQGRGANADLMLLLTHIIRQHGYWRHAHVRLLRVVKNVEGVAATQMHSEQMLESVRVDAEPVIIVRDVPNQPLAEVIAQHSQGADLTLIGMKLPEDEDLEAYGERLDALVHAVGSVLLVRNAELDEDLLTPE